MFHDVGGAVRVFCKSSEVEGKKIFLIVVYDMVNFKTGRFMAQVDSDSLKIPELIDTYNGKIFILTSGRIFFVKFHSDFDSIKLNKFIFVAVFDYEVSAFKFISKSSYKLSCNTVDIRFSHRL